MASNNNSNKDNQIRSASASEHSVVAAELPWGAVKMVTPSLLDPSVQPGQFAAQTLIVDFVICADRKLANIMHESLEKHLTKALQRGEDPNFDNIVRALNGVSEYSLPSVLRSLIGWYEEQKQYCAWLQHSKTQQQAAKQTDAQQKQLAKNEIRIDTRDFVIEKRALAVDFIFCLVLIEILPQLYLHPGHEEQINHIIQLSFKQFKYKDPVHVGPNMSNSLIIADLYAEVIGVLAQSRFQAVRKKFTKELTELRHEKDSSPLTAQNIIGILMGMKFFRVKTNQMEELETGMNFLHELGLYYVEVKDRDIKQSIAGLLVEILLPVAAQVKTETNIPHLIAFVDLLYSHTLDLASKKKHQLSAFPLLTCLLCISQNKFFLANWHYFLTLTLSNLKSKDPKMSRVALESLYRLLWVYVIRIGCESNTATHSRLQSICNSLFPKGGRGIIPREAPLNIFVKIIHFIAQEKLDFAFKEIIFDLLCVGRMVRTVYPERMNIGLRALMVIADGLQQKEGPPGMPRGHGPIASGTIQRIKKTYLTRPLSADVARTIGLDQYYGPCRRAFDGIIRALDLQVGRPMMLNVLQGSGKEPDELLSGERKPKLDLMRTCVASIPRLLPEGMSHQDLIDLLARMTIHMDEELRGLACQTLQNLMTECQDWREDIIHGFLQFITRDIQDGYPSLLDNALRLLLQLICAWKTHFLLHQKRDQTMSETIRCGESAPANANRVQVSPLLNGNGSALVLHCVEGLALVMLCQGRSIPRKLAANLLKEVKQLLPLLCGEDHERAVIDVLDSATPYVINKYIQHVSATEKTAWLSSTHVDFMWMCEKIPTLEADFSLINADKGNEYLQWDTWAVALSGFTESQFHLVQCPTATAYAWPLAYTRLNACFGFVDPNNPQNDTRASLLRSSKSKASSMALCGETLNYSHYLSLWQKYLVLTCAVAPPAANTSALVRSVSPVNVPMDTSETFLSSTRSLELRIPRVANVSATNLFKWVVPLLRCEMTDMRDIVALGLGSVNPSSFECLFDELQSMLRDAAEKKQENVRRRRRRDLLRLQLIRLMEIVMFRGTLPLSSMVDSNTSQLKPVLLDFVENARQYLESDQDRDVQIFGQMRLHFAKMVTLLINGFPVEKRLSLLNSDKKHHLFFLFTSWCSRIGLALDRKHSRDRDTLSWLEHHSVTASCAVLCCGSVFESNKALGDEGYLYGWLDALMTSHNQKVEPLSEETVALLLDFNAEMGQLLDWVIDRCYTTTNRVADKCFRALAAVFAQREYPCDIVSMFSLTLMYSGYPLVEMQQVAVELLQVLDQRYFGDNPLPYNADSGIDGSENESDKSCHIPLMTDVLNSKWSQYSLSIQLAELHPEMTMPIFSEVSLRLESAKPARQAAMLRYLLPWLYNIELMDPNLEPSDRTVTLSFGTKLAESQAMARRVLKGDGWGSRPATEMILNNLLYMTVKFGNEHATLLEQLWSSLVAYWPSNLRVILRYLAVMVTLAPESLLNYVKRIVVYLARINPDRLVEDLINELQTVDSFRCPLERTEMAPYYRCRKGEEDRSTLQRNHDDKEGMIHTRRHTPSDSQAETPPTSISGAAAVEDDFDDENMLLEARMLDPSASMTSLITLKADILNAKPATPTMEAVDEKVSDKIHREYIQAFQLPMPAYGGHYCPLNVYLPDTNQAVLPLYRSNLAVLMMTDLVIADVDIEWTVHMPLILHMATLGLDSVRPLVCEHCKQLLLNLIVVQSNGQVPVKEVATVLLSNSLGPTQQLASSHSNRHSLIETSTNNEQRWDTVNSRASTAIVMDSGSVSAASSVCVSRSDTPAPAQNEKKSRGSSMIFEDSIKFSSLNQLVLAMTDCLASKQGSSVLWQSEDVTAKCWRIGSAQQLSKFVLHLNQLMNDLLPAARIQHRWAQTALHIALCCSNRHLAGRSFQVFRALRTAPTTRQLSDVLSRLVETVGEQSDDMMQGYVTEIMLTLDNAVLHMEVAEHSLVNLFRGDLHHQLHSVDGPPANQLAAVRSSPTHARSTSYSAYSAVVRHRMSPAQDRKDVRNSTGSDDLYSSNGQQALPRSKSAQALKSVPEGQEEHMTAMAQLCWIATSLLESDLEHEFLLAMHLLDKILDLPSFERQDCLDRLDRMTKPLNWINFPGLLSLVLKGCVFPVAYEFTISILVKLLPLLEYTVVDPDQSGFGLIVVALLPYLLVHYENPTRLCVSAADSIGEYCAELVQTSQQQQQGSSQAAQTPVEQPLEHLGVVMRLYSKKSFSKDCIQWTKCICKYLHDLCPTVDPELMILLAEMLERNAVILHQAILQILYCIFQHLDMNNTSSVAINAYVLKAISKHIQGPNWREAARIMKLTVTRSSSLSVPSTNNESDEPRRELSGRTMEFSVDMNSLSSSLGLTKDHTAQENLNTSAGAGSPRKQPGGSGESSLRRQNIGQMRVREHLVSLLNQSGLRVGLPKSPSVIFSQSSHDIAAELPSSVYSSSGELTGGGERASTPSPEGGTLGTDYTSDSFPRVFKEFDFLEAEHDSVSESADSCFNWLSTMRPRSISSSGEDRSAAGSPGLLHTTPSVPCQIDGHLVLRQSPESDSSDEEGTASSQAEEDSVECTVSGHDMERLFVERRLLEDQTDTRPTTPASASRLSLCGSMGTPSVDWSLLSGASPSLALECTHHATGQVEENWTLTVTDLLNDQDGVITANATLIFTQLYREACGKVSGLFRDACHFLSMSETFKSVASQFLETLDVLMRIGECPFLFVTPQLLRTVGLLHRQKFTLFELREHYETFQERREHCIRTLNGVKSSLKLQLMGQKLEENTTFDQEIELCRNLHKLFFQLLLMCEGFNKMVKQFTSKTGEQSSNLSVEVRELQRELLCAVNELASVQESVAPVEMAASSPVGQLVQLLQNRHLKQSILYLRQSRNQQSSKVDLYGCCEEEDVEVLLLLYCKATAETQPSFLSVVGSASAFSDGCQQLMEMDLQLSATVRSLSLPRNRILVQHHSSSQA